MNDEPQSALLLTNQEWTDLAAICDHYAWDVREEVMRYDKTIVGRRAQLCKRIMEAAE